MLCIDIETRIDSFSLAVKLELLPAMTIILGPSGSGKSSLLNCISGLHKPERGAIKCGNETFFDSSSGTNMPVQKRRCGYVLQNLALFPHMNVAENICFGIDKWKKAEKQERLNELLSLVKLDELAGRRISQLSGGQLQRVALARALAPAPQVLLLDEPFSALESELREELAEEIKSMQRSLGIPVLMVTHLKSEAILLADTLVLIEDGRVRSVHNTGSGDLSSASSLLEPGVQFSW